MNIMSLARDGFQDMEFCLKSQAKVLESLETPLVFPSLEHPARPSKLS